MNGLNLQQIIGEVLSHLRGMWRYRWWANGVAWLLFLVGWIYVCTIPDIYRASTRVFLDTNSLLKPLMQGLTASNNTLDEVQLVSKAVLTRPNLEKVAQQTDLALRAKTTEDLEVLVTGLQQQIHVMGRPDNIFTIEYEDVSREKARAVVSAVLDTFVENSIGNEGSDQQVTERALSGEVAVHERRLREAEERLAKFKQDNLGYMPGEYGDYYNRLQKATSTAAEARDKLRLVEQRRSELSRQINGEEPVFGIMGTAAQGTASAGCSQETNIRQLETQLASLRVEFTDKHPRVVHLRESIEELQRACDADRAAARSAGVIVAPAEAGRLETNPVYQNLRIQLSNTEVNRAEIQSQLGSAETLVATLHRNVDKITEVEAQLKQLNRDYEVVQARHQELLKRWEDLQAKKRLDPVTDKVQFRRIEPPFALADPVGPNRPLLLAVVLVFALGGGALVAFALNQLHPVFFTRNSLRTIAGFPVLGAISMILTDQATMRRRWEALAWGGVCGALIVFSAFAVVFASATSALLRTLGGVGA